MFQFHRMQPPVRRLLALDAGSRRIKLLLAQAGFGRLRVLKEELIDLQAEGLVGAEEIKAHLRTALEDWGRPPVALALPQHVSTSQVVDLPAAPESEVEKLITDEIVKLSGVTESRIVYDFVRTTAPVDNRQQFWVTLCQETEIRDRLLQLGIEHEDLCEVTTTANALIAAYRMTAPLSSRAILVHMGAQTTVLVVLLGGQGAFASSFQMGSDFFTRSLARLEKIGEDAAEVRKREQNLLSGSEVLPEFAAVVDGWIAETRRQLADWTGHNPTLASELSAVEMIASGGGFDQPGLLEYLKGHGLILQPWPAPEKPGTAAPGKGFEIALGTALQALGYSNQPVSLLPDDYRAGWQKRLMRQRIDLASLGVACLCLLLLVLGTWQKLALFNRKTAVLSKVQAGQKTVLSNDLAVANLLSEYDSLRPILAAQQNTIDTLKTLSLLQQSRTNRDLWYVLIADQPSYFRLPPALLYTNRPARTNLLGSALEPLRPPGSQGGPGSFLTNVSSAKPGLIAELCVPGEAEAARQVLSDLVRNLKHQPLFSKVDLLSDDLRRNLADPRVVVPDRHFVLALDFASADYLQPLRLKRPNLPVSPRPTKRPHPSWAAPENGTGSMPP